MHKLCFILGCTASGKGGVGRALAGAVGGEIVSVDSMKIYRRMDIGTGKPSAEARAAVTHHCVDLVEPSESFSVAQYVEAADEAVAAIHARGAVPLAVGGTSLYIKALSEGLFEGPPADAEVRAELKARAQRDGLAALHVELGRVDVEAASRIHPNDERRIVRALEVYRTTGTPISELQKQWDSGERRYDCTFIGLRREREDLHGRINARAKRMVEMGLRDEVAALLAEPGGLSVAAAQGVGYAELIDHLQGRCTLDEALERIKINTRRLAKKQRTWHRRWRDVQWLDVPADEAPDETAGRARAMTDFS
jgi:tRNA dimethylallyltransferase